MGELEGTIRSLPDSLSTEVLSRDRSLDLSSRQPPPQHQALNPPTSVSHQTSTHAPVDAAGKDDPLDPTPCGAPRQPQLLTVPVPTARPPPPNLAAGRRASARRHGAPPAASWPHLGREQQHRQRAMGPSLFKVVC
ncbi:hypothetical protein S40285_09812 [Stachybotrys chlorohalonatus IBT 40285]|uniref:Uncharacterized protein n=1 Tax=Stachybotrys chlorohalonatus (strain IBT 40285) TaxID=1283841 RepID=A0A084QZ46_STAC4|nr:hypothetical protein S40285_09812 [Stachybotrys chlorohalonata IBT 40285]